MRSSQKAEARRSRGQLLALLLVMFAIIPFDTLDYLYPQMEHFLERTYFIIPCWLFLCTVLTSPLTTHAKHSFLLSTIAVLWFTAVQQHHQLALMGADSLSLFSVVYLLAFPFAAVVGDETKNDGMKWVGITYIVGTLLLVLCSALLLFDKIPKLLVSRIFWDGSRLNALWHPNIVACMFMIGIGFTLYFLVQAGSNVRRSLLCLLALIQFLGLSLTNCRTAIILTCALVGGTVLWVRLYIKPKVFLLNTAIALTTIAVLFFFSHIVFDFHTRMLSSQPVPQAASQQKEQTCPTVEESYLSNSEETSSLITVDTSPFSPVLSEMIYTPPSSIQSPQGTLIEDIWTLNNRTLIWKAAFSTIRDNHAIRIWGTKDVSTEISLRSGLPVAHAHNSWIQVRMELGLPGLLIALIYTGIAMIQSARILFFHKTDPGKKVIALMVLSIMVASFLEPFLFIGGLSTLFVNFIFFFLTGFLDYWCWKYRITNQKV